VVDLFGSPRGRTGLVNPGRRLPLQRFGVPSTQVPLNRFAHPNIAPPPGVPRIAPTNPYQPSGAPWTVADPRTGNGSLIGDVLAKAQRSAAAPSSAAAPTPTVPPSGSVPLSDFSPGNDLRFTQINPTLNPGTQAVQGLAMGDVTALHNAPDRGALAAQTFDQIRRQGEPAYEHALQGVGQKAAALGRLGAGMTTSELGDVASTRQKNLDFLSQQLATDAAGQTLQDRLATLGATAGYQGQLFGQGQAQQEALRGERAFESGTAQQALDNATRQQALMASLGLQGAEMNYRQGSEASGAAGDVLGNLALQHALGAGTPPGSTPGPQSSLPPGWEYGPDGKPRPRTA
jgi:hypothetical protein